MAAGRWLVAGFLVGIGVVGYFTGLIVALGGVALALFLLNQGTRGGWFFVVGAGAGAAILTLDDVLRYGNGSCRQVDAPHPFHECPAAGIPEIFWAGLALAAIGLIGAAVSSSLRKRMNNAY